MDDPDEIHETSIFLGRQARKLIVKGQSAEAREFSQFCSDFILENEQYQELFGEDFEEILQFNLQTLYKNMMKKVLSDIYILN